MNFRRLLSSFALASLGWASLAHAQTCGGTDERDDLRAADPAAYAAVEAKAAAQPDGEGLLWKVERGGAPPSYLFGTYHFAPGDGAPKGVAALVANARVAYLEALAAEQTEMQAAFRRTPSIFLNKTPVPLESFLPRELAEAAAKRLEVYGVPAAAAPMLQPWFLQLLFTVPPCVVQAAAAGAETMDRRIEDFAVENGVDVKGLETWRDQIAIFADEPLDRQRIGLLLTLSQTIDPDDAMATMAALYAEERPLMIWELSMHKARAAARDFEQVAPQDIDRMGAEAWKIILSDRNAKMVEKLTPELQRGGVFVAVGALHLGGTGGIAPRLRALGFDVTRVE